MILGVDLVDVARFRVLLERAPRFADRFFTEEELRHCGAAPDQTLSLAGTFAAKEAVMKALRLTPAPAWSRRIEIVRRDDGAPHALVGGREVTLSLSHDGGFVVAVAASIGGGGAAA